MSVDVASLIERLAALDIRLRVDGDRLGVNAPQGALTPALRDELSRHKAEILAWLRERPAAAAQELPLSHAQQRLWFIKQMDPGNVAYQIPFAMRLTGLVNPQALQRAIDRLVARHDSLRMSFSAVDGVARSRVQAEATVPLQQADVSALAPSARDAAALEHVQALIRQPFDLARAPLMRALLVRQSDTEHVFALAFDHIISDGLSLGIFLGELQAAYSALAAGLPDGLPAAPQYAQHVVWEQQQIERGGYDVHRDYWKRQLANLPSLLTLPTDRPRPAMQSARGGLVAVSLPPEAATRLKAFARAEGATLFMVLMAGFQALLHRYSGEADFGVGTVVANRQRAEAERALGLFVNNIVLRADLSARPTVRELVARVREATLKGFAHEAMPFDMLVDALAPKRALDHSPLFQVMFVLQSVAFEQMDMAGATCSRFDIPLSAARYDIAVDAYDRADGLTAVFEYNADLFDASTVQRMAQHYGVLLQALAAQPEARIDEISLYPDGLDPLLLRLNDTAQALDTTPFPLQFEAQVARTPERIALSMDDARLSYDALNRRANQLAHHLRALGVAPGKLVALCMDRCLDLVVALLAIQKTGAAYVPLDPGFPAARLAFMLEDSEAGVLITAGDAADAVEVPPQVQVVNLDTQADALRAMPEANPKGAHGAQEPAYMIYTSGSTGKPKGVLVPKAALANFLSSMRREPGIEADDVMAAVTTISFDIAGLELYLPLVAGARVHLVSRDTATDGPTLARTLDACGATLLQATPATWRLLVEAGWQPSRPMRAFCGGEPLPRDLADALLPRVSALWNLYGPTETTIWSTAECVAPAPAPITIGRPIANTQVYVVAGEGGQPAPLGVAGELWIGGDGVALGYHRRPELTAERFVPDRFHPDVPQARLYRTGDLARVRPDGKLEHLGRMDHQVKVRGFRIELGEIEAALAAHEAVRQAVVVAREAAPGDVRLVAYVVYQAGEDLTVSEVRRHLRRELPDYMIPSVVVALETVPLTPNGKVDRKALPDPFKNLVQREAAFEPPAPGLEQALAEIWREVLQVPRVGADDNFFELGGHSLLSLRVAAAVQQRCGWKLDPRVLFFQSLRQIAAAAPEGQTHA